MGPSLKFLLWLLPALLLLIFIQSGECKNDKQAEKAAEKAERRKQYTSEAAPGYQLEPGSKGGKPPKRDKYRAGKDDVAKEIKKKGKKWVADINPIFDEENVTDIQELLGAKYVPAPLPATRPPGKARHGETFRLPEKRGGGNNTIYDDDEEDDSSSSYNSTRSKRQSEYAYLPKTYDVRQDYPQCTSVASIRTQSGCSGCFAFAASSAMSDRHCIYNYYRTGQIFISPFHILQCVPDGCQGGIEWDAMAYWKKGLVSGGAAAYGVYQPDGCLPLPYSPSSAPSGCPTSCSNTRHYNTFEKDKTYGGYSNVKWFPSVQWIQNEIYMRGPVVAFMVVYDDFMYYYKSGVYEQVSQNKLGPHTVKLIGWGTTSDGIDYWLAVNTWGLGWGENGLFKIRRGVNMCQIEARISWALPIEAGY